MDAKQYLMAQLAKFGADETDIDLIILENDIPVDYQVTGKADTIVLKRAMFQFLPGMIAGLADITEGGYSRKWNVNALKLWLSALATEIGLPDPFAEAPAKITGRKVW